MTVVSDPVRLGVTPDWRGRGLLEVGLTAGEIEDGDVVVIGRNNPADGETLYEVPAGKTFRGTAAVVTAVDTAGRCGVVDATDGRDLATLELSAAVGEPRSVRVEVEVPAAHVIACAAAGRCHVLIVGRLSE